MKGGHKAPKLFSSQLIARLARLLRFRGLGFRVLARQTCSAGAKAGCQKHRSFLAVVVVVHTIFRFLFQLMLHSPVEAYSMLCLECIRRQNCRIASVLADMGVYVGKTLETLGMRMHNTVDA